MIRTDKVRVRDADLGSPAEAADEAGEPLLVPKASPKKSRFWGFVALLSLVGVSLALVVLWQRDTNIIDKALLRAEPFRRAIEAAMGPTRQLPLALPRTALDGKPFSDKGFVYLPADTIRFLRSYEGSVLVGFASPCATALTPNRRRTLVIISPSRCMLFITHAFCPR